MTSTLEKLFCAAICVMSAFILFQGGSVISHINVEPITMETIKSTSIIHDQRGQDANTSHTFKILFWTSSYYGGNKWFGIGKEVFSSCQYTNCMSTNDRKELMSSDAVLFHMVFMDKNLPDVRLPNQKWIMHVRESPIYQYSYRKYNGIFNTTWTYDRSSDIWTNYSHISPLRGLFVKKGIKERAVVNRNFAEGRNKIVAWFVSHCNTQSQRLQYVKHLQRYMNVDIYGRCGTLHCKRHGVQCFNMLNHTYKFYLSFENSLCKDYVTEKLWKAIECDVVPIVMGAYNYSELLPPNSYIDINDFASPKELANYLIKLDKNDTLYNQYFFWKSKYKIVQHPPLQCNVCEYLNVARDIKKTYDRLDLFWDKQTKCYAPSVFYENVNKSTWT